MKENQSSNKKIGEIGTAILLVLGEESPLRLEKLIEKVLLKLDPKAEPKTLETSILFQLVNFCGENNKLVDRKETADCKKNKKKKNSTYSFHYEFELTDKGKATLEEQKKKLQELFKIKDAETVLIQAFGKDDPNIAKWIQTLESSKDLEL